VEEEIGGVGHSSGAAGTDLVAGLELIEFAEGMVGTITAWSETVNSKNWIYENSYLN